jgi:hypothetical protein
VLKSLALLTADFLGHCLQTLGACLNLHPLSIAPDPGLLDVWLKLALGVAHRMADIVSKLWFFTADFTDCHVKDTSLLN